jgi:NADH:ubiquinone oxidoreductase subunit 3 (subunit A)
VELQVLVVFLFPMRMGVHQLGAFPLKMRMAIIWYILISGLDLVLGFS